MTERDVKNSLGYAVWSDDLATVQRLLAEGHDVDIDAWGQGIKTPLMESLDEHADFYDDERQAMTACSSSMERTCIDVTNPAVPHCTTRPESAHQPWRCSYRLERQ